VKVSVFVGASVDGFIARRDGTLDFLPAGGGEPHGYEEFLADIDAIVIGRHTYESVLDFDVWPYAERPVFVLSTSSLLTAPEEAVVERLQGDPAEVVAQLSRRGFRHLYIDGGLTIQAFLRTGLIQRLIITRVPVLIGAGIPLFGPTGRDIELRHVATRTFDNGLVRSEYEMPARPLR
jgi:dihydrofolate reductase